MDYHLHYQGQNLGVFPLEELRRRRERGELSGAELVWREGMPNWVSLESILQPGDAASACGVVPPPLPPAARKKSRHARIAVAIFVASAIVVGFAAYKFVQRMTFVVNTVRESAEAGGMNQASRPVVSSPSGVTERSRSPRRKAFRIRQYVDGYRANGRHSAPCDAEALQLLQCWIAESFGETNSKASARALGDKLAAQPGCDDPLMLTAAAAGAVDWHERTRRFDRALAGFENSSHKAYPKFYAAVALGTELGTRSPRLREVDQKALKYFQQAFTDGSFQPGDEEEIADILVVGWGYGWLGRNSTAVARVAKEAGGFVWLAQLLEGEDHLALAWAARGGGYADGVTDAGWQGFADHTDAARAAYTRAWNTQPRRALAAARMVYVVMGDGDSPEMRTWFDRATEAQIDSPSAWNHMRWGLRPRWHGSLEAMEALGIRAVDTRRFDTDVPRKFFDVVSDLESELQLEPGQHIYGRGDIWLHFQRMYEGYIAEPLEASRRDGWRSSYAAVAFLAGKYDVARQQLEALDWHPSPLDHTAWGRDLSLMPLQVAALTGKSAAQVNRAETSYERRELAGAAKICSELSASPQTDEQTRKYCQSRLAALRQEELLAKGDWISLLPSGETDPSWALQGDQVRALADGAIEIGSGPRGHGCYCRARVGADFEVTGEFEVVRSSTQDFQAGIIMGMPGGSGSEWYGFRLKQNANEGQIASFSRGWSTYQVWRKISLDGKRNAFRFRLQKGKADAWVNGTQVMQQAVLSKTLRLGPDSLLGLGAYNDMNETVIRYRDVKVRRLP